jgi:hypothetical protein
VALVRVDVDDNRRRHHHHLSASRPRRRTTSHVILYRGNNHHGIGRVSEFWIYVGGVDIGYYDTLDMERVVVVVLEFEILAPRVPFL